MQQKVFTMDMPFLVEMKKSKKWESVRNVEIINLHLGSGAGTWVSIHWTAATFIDSNCPK